MRRKDYGKLSKRVRNILSIFIAIVLIFGTLNSVYAETNIPIFEQEILKLFNRSMGSSIVSVAAVKKTGPAKVNKTFALLRSEAKFFCWPKYILRYDEPVNVIASEDTYSLVTYENRWKGTDEAYIRTRCLTFIKGQETRYVAKGEKRKLSDLFKGEGYSNFKSSDYSTVDITDDNKIEGLKQGVAVISADKDNGTKRITIYVFNRWINMFSTGNPVNYYWKIKTGKMYAGTMARELTSGTMIFLLILR